MSKAVLRNVAIILAVALVIDLVPAGGTGASVVVAALRVAFYATFMWGASLMYREHRTSLYSLGDNRRAILYVAGAVGFLTLSATSRLWHSPAGSVAWLVLLAGAIYAIFAVVWSARRY